MRFLSVGFLLLCITQITFAQQLANTILMVPPKHFQYNTETAKSNTFMNKNLDGNIQAKAMQEFEQMKNQLRKEDINVLTLLATTDVTPDAVFPNNWFSLHKNADQTRTLVLYPMEAPNRRLERQTTSLIELLATHEKKVDRIVQLDKFEKLDRFLEGTGSLVLDRKNKVAFAALSSRTHPYVLREFKKAMNYKIITFNATDSNAKPIYHTNVMMSIGNGFSVICLECIRDKSEKDSIIKELKRLNKEIIEISLEQAKDMCGNILQVESTLGTKKIVMSQTAFESFSPQQIKQLQQYGKIIAVLIPTIENIGGGSARCMMAEVI